MQQSLHDRIGGDAAIEAAVDIFYRKFTQHKDIVSFFEGVTMPLQEAKMRNFLTLVMGGKIEYSREQIRTAHAPLIDKGLNDHHFDIFMLIMKESLLELDIPLEIIDEFIDITEEYRKDVLLR